MDKTIPISCPDFGPDELNIVQEPLKSGWVLQGKFVSEFESLFADYVDSPKALATSSGTAALHVAVLATNVGPGDEVIVPAYTWVATANVIELTGAKPVFCDIDLATFNLDSQLVAQAINPHTVGILPVHLFGLCADIVELKSIAERRSLWVIEDAACALGSYIGEQHAGTFGLAGCFSFHPRKSITTGEGGMVVTSDPDLARQMAGYRNHGAVPLEGDHSQCAFEIAGLNYRLTDIQGALGVAQMRRFPELLQKRLRCAEFYTDALSDLDWLRLPSSPPGFTHSWQSYVMLFAPDEPTLGNVDALCRKRDRLVRFLSEKGISTRPGTHAPAHLPYYASKYGITPSQFPNAWIAEKLSIALPLFASMTSSQLHYIVETLHMFEV